MGMRILSTLLLVWATADAEVAEGTIVPPVQGAYLGARIQSTANPWNAGVGANFGWREVMYQAEHPAFSYNYIGMEFITQDIVQKLDFGVRVVFQPASFLQTSLAYDRIGYPFGLVSVSGQSNGSEDDIWNFSNGLQSSWADEFTLNVSVQKEIGNIQGRIQGRWSRLDIDNKRDSLYEPSEDIVLRSRDDIVGLEISAGYITQAPFLAAVGPAATYLRTFDHDIERTRAGLWIQAWPFSRKQGEVIPYWTVKSRLDLWTEHPTRQWQPRLELTIGWERNIFQSNQ